MTNLVPTEDIERIVGAKRHQTRHIAKAVSAEQTVYILHSHECFNTTPDLRDCRYSLALDNGIDVSYWTEDVPVFVVIENGEELWPEENAPAPEALDA